MPREWIDDGNGEEEIRDVISGVCCVCDDINLERNDQDERRS